MLEDYVRYVGCFTLYAISQRGKKFLMFKDISTLFFFVDIDIDNMHLQSCNYMPRSH